MSAPQESPRAQRLATLRTHMREQGLEWFVVRATDRFLNEYVPTAESTRVWLSGFTGSTGDALVGLEGAWMFVDGRYDLQATKELDSKSWTVEKVALGTPIEMALAERIAARTAKRAGDGKSKVGFEPDRFSLDLFARFSEWVGPHAELVPTLPSLVETVRGALTESTGTVRAVDEESVGRSVHEKIAAVATWMAERGAVAMVVQRLDELAYLTNLRGTELPFQATFRATALVLRDVCVVAVDPKKVPEDVRSSRPRVRFVRERELLDSVKALGAGAKIAMDPGGTTVAMRLAVESVGAVPVLATSPLTVMKARKTAAELSVMREAFKKADRVVADAQKWLIGEVLAGKKITEVAFAQQVEAMFTASGAVGLSFKVISACGENAAVAHHPSDPDRVIGRGEMMLLDTGAYYAEGYATDLTRTFFVGDASDQPTADMKRWFTLTLKAAVAGMSARIPRGANGAQLDGIVRSPLWAEGLEFSHGTGHGVGINVHEAPPRVANVSANMKLEEGHVFSIEPGVYIAGRGGVRIENLCTVVPDADDPGFLRVRSMTFSPLDARLIDDAMLTAQERAYLAWFAKGYEA